MRQQQVTRSGGVRRKLELHTGIETGPVYVRVTDSRAGLFDITGDVVNTAARLRSLAESGEVLLGPTTAERTAQQFDTEARAPVLMRGKQQPLVPHVVRGRTRNSNPMALALARGGLTRYVGRDGPLAALCSVWTRTLQGQSALVTIEGPAGIGKSRLVHELCMVARAASPAPLILQGRCIAYSAAPYQPFIDALLAKLEELATDDVPQLALTQIAPLSETSMQVLSYLLAPGLAAEPRALASGERLRQAIVDALCELVERVTAERPLLIALEDFHDADEPSRTAVQQLMATAQGKNLLIVINHRPSATCDALHALAAEHVCLEPLDEPTTSRMAESVLMADVEPDLASYIHERTLGNPFFVEEICRSLVEAQAVKRQVGLVVRAQTLALSPAPSSVQSVVRTRSERLAPLPKKALRLASVIGLEFSVPALEMLWATPSLAQSALVAEPAWRATAAADEAQRLHEALRELERQQLVAPVADTLMYRFKHAITREVVYQSLPRRERAWYHGRLASFLEHSLAQDDVQSHYEALAYHYGLSNEVGKAVDFAILSGDKAWNAFSLEQANAQYARAIQLLGSYQALDGPQKRRHIEVSVSWARVGLYNPHPDQLAALQSSLHHAEQLGDARAACACLNWQSWIEYALGNHARAWASSSAFLASAEGLADSSLVAQALANVGLSHVLSGQYEQAIASIHAGIDKRGRSTGTAYAYSLGYLALIHGDRGDFVRAHDHLERAWHIVQATGRDTLQGPALIQRGMVQAWHGEWSACIETASQAHTTALRIGGSYIRAMSATLHGYALGMRDPAEHVRAIALVQQGVSILESLRIGLHLSWCCALLAELLVCARRFADARAAATRALEHAEVNDRLGEAAAHRVLAQVAHALDEDHEVASQHLGRARTAAQRKGSAREVALNALAFARLNARTPSDASRRALGEALSYFEQQGLAHFQQLAQAVAEARTS